MAATFRGFFSPKVLAKKLVAKSLVIKGIQLASKQGDLEGAVKVIDDSKDKLQIQGWINELRNGKNPFTPEVLEDLRKEFEKELEKKSNEQIEQL